MKIKYLLFFLLFFTPLFTRAEIIISEIAWMGSVSSANTEWIEIQNTGSSSVNLTGWTLVAEDGTPSINLSGNINSGSYALLERSNDDTVPQINALVVYTGALGNDGEHLILRDGNGTTIQNLNFSSGWPAGNNNTKETMQWNGSIWITAPSTPGVQNAVFDSGTTGNQGTDGDLNDQSDISSSDESNNQSSSSKSSSTIKEKIKYDSDLVEIRVTNSHVPIGTPVNFSLHTRDTAGANIIRGNFLWNMGDGTEYLFNKNENFKHFYEHEGSYVVSIRYYSTYFEDIPPNATHRITLNVSRPGIIVNNIHYDGGVELKNTSGQEVDLSGWILRDNQGRDFIIPKNTFILPGKSMTFNSRQTKMNALNVALLNPMGKFVSFKEKISSTGNNSQMSKVSNSINSNTVDNKSSKLIIDNEVNINSDNNILNDFYTANTSNLEQRQLSPWVVAFVAFVLFVCVAVYFLYKKFESNEEPRDDFELLD